MCSGSADEHSLRDLERKLDEEREQYHNGALFGLDATIPADEQDDSWTAVVLPDEQYLESPRLAGSAWLHVERRHQGGDA